MSQHEPISLSRFAAKSGVSVETVLRWCRAGSIDGARIHPITKKWMIYPPALIVRRFGHVSIKSGGAL